MGPGEAEGEAQREASAPAGAREGVTLEDVAVRFSAEEWALLEGWQKALHREVMQENVTLLLSLGHSVPTEALPSLIRETLEDQVLGSSGDGRSDAEGGEPPFAEEAAEAEGPWELDCLSDQEEGGLAPGRTSKGDRQSSLHLCALMKLVKEIPEFLYGHGKAGGDSSGCSEPGLPAEEQPPWVKVEAHLENLHRSSLEADLAVVSPGLSSHPGTPASSAEGDWAEPPSGGLHGHDESRSLPSCEGHTEAGAERTPPAPARDSPSRGTAGVTDLQRAKSGVGKGLPKETDLRGPEPDASRPGRPSSSGSPAAAPLDCLSPQGGLHTNGGSSDHSGRKWFGTRRSSLRLFFLLL